VASSPLPEPGNVIELEATMRDGTVLRADAYRPSSGDGPWPVLLARTPYGRKDPGVIARLDPAKAAGRGHLVIVQDCRGRFGSQGSWTPLAHERTDGYDTVAWAAQLPYADGRVAMYGPSYLGHAQWAALADQPPELRAVIPEFTWADPYDGLITRGGANELGLMTQWTLGLGTDVLERRFADQPIGRRRRLAELNDAIEGLTARTYWELPPGETLRRLNLPLPRPDQRSVAGSGRAEVPALIVAGWYDCFLQGGLDAYVRARTNGTPVSLLVGPWSHDDQSSRVGEGDFGEAADAAAIDHGGSLLDRELDWLDRQLRHRPRSAVISTTTGTRTPKVEPEQTVLVFVMGADEWRRMPTWPPAAADTSWFLHPRGELSLKAPEPGSAPDVFRNDPSNPVPTRGGALLLTPEFPAGPFDQEAVEKHDDVLVYTSAPMRAPLEVIGRVRVLLLGDSTAPVTDWVARLCDVDADGISRNLTDGIVRKRAAGKGEVSIDLWSTAHVFLPGHRIRLQVTASCFPRWDRGAPARQRVHHDSARPSRLILPVAKA
jgi:hypothetical protein